MNNIDNIIVYNNGEIELKISEDNKTIWASIQDIAKIFEIDRSVVSRHIRNIFKDNELDEKVVCAKFAHTTRHGVLNNKAQTREIKYYNLDIILAVGYRTNSAKAIKFRQLAMIILNFEFLMLNLVIYNSKLIIQHYFSWFAFSEMDSKSLSILERLK